ncbi:putative 2EXR domain-containing protein [Seiridium unicorne]|uniref:2EXR domain-containing protein n=1 Tax=Seiridium unicorne TaxID=138068 RepID=A0ABR2UHM8_9PEZI
MASSQEDDILKHVSHIMPSFPRFTRLPPELRWAIWNMSLPPRRFIAKASQAYLPRALHVCRESRSRALSKGKLCYGNHDTGKNLLWINPSQDAVELSLAADQTPDPELREHYPTLRHVTRIFVTTQFKIDAERDYKWDSPIMFLQHPWGRRLLNHADTMLICPRDVMCRPPCSPSLLWRRTVSRSMSSILIVHSYKHHTIRALFQEHDYLEIDLRQTDEITRVLTILSEDGGCHYETTIISHYKFLFGGIQDQPGNDRSWWKHAESKARAAWGNACTAFRSKHDDSVRTYGVCLTQFHEVGTQSKQLPELFYAPYSLFWEFTGSWFNVSTLETNSQLPTTYQAF